MVIHSPATHAVFQRNRQGLAEIPIEVTAEGEQDEQVYARIVAPGQAASGEWELVGKLRAGAFKGALRGIASGGPYELQVRIGTQVAVVRDLLVGDLFILAGQSNMDGWGKLAGTEAPSRMVHCFYFDDRWAVARDPLCWYNEAVDPVHWRLNGRDREAAIQEDRDFRTSGAGPGVRFGKEVYKRQGVPVGLIICSQGGTSMEQWSPAKLGEGGNSLYGSMIRRVKAVGGRVKGCLWYQGESDAATEDGLRYLEHLKAFIEAMRRDLSQPQLPFLVVQLGPYYGGDGFPHWNKVQTDQVAIENELDNVATVSAVDLQLDDGIHLSTASQKVLGVRLARLADRLIYGNKSQKLGPRFQAAKVSQDRLWVEVRFSEVNGNLRPRTGFHGFTIEASGRQVPIPTRKVAGPHTVLLGLRQPLPEGAVLWYGKGLNPTVNLRDAAGLPCPVFGPIPL